MERVTLSMWDFFIITPYQRDAVSAMSFCSFHDVPTLRSRGMEASSPPPSRLPLTMARHLRDVTNTVAKLFPP